MDLGTSAAPLPSGVFGACAKVLRARLRLEEAMRAGPCELNTGRASAQARMAKARDGYFAALENYFYAAERAAGRDPERDPDE